MHEGAPLRKDPLFQEKLFIPGTGNGKYLADTAHHRNGRTTAEANSRAFCLAKTLVPQASNRSSYRFFADRAFGIFSPHNLCRDIMQVTCDNSPCCISEIPQKVLDLLEQLMVGIVRGN